MGQQQALQKALNPFAPGTFYEMDIRLLQKMQNYASSFPADLQEIVSQAQQFYIRQPDHFLAEFIILEINDRFNSLSINKEAMESVTNNKTILQIFQINPNFLTHKFWHELESIQKFLKFLERVQQKYWIEQQLYEVLQRGNDNNSKGLDKKNKAIACNQKQNVQKIIQSSNKKQSFVQMPSIRKPLKLYSSTIKILKVKYFNLQQEGKHQMLRKVVMLVSFLAILLLKADCIKIDHFEQVEKFQGQPKVIEGEHDSMTHMQRLLQTASLTADDTTLVITDILTKLNALRSKSNLSELIQTQESQSIIQRWSAFFKSIYSLNVYLSRIGRYPGSKIIEFSNYSEKVNLIKAIEQQSTNWISIQRLTQVGIVVQIVDNKYYCFVLLKGINQFGNEIVIESFTENLTSGLDLEVNQARVISTITTNRTTNNTSTSITLSNVTETKSTSINTLTSNFSTAQTSLSSSSTNSTSLQSSQSISTSNSIIPSNAIQNTKLSNALFNGMILYHDFPSTFTNTQLFSVRGRVLSPPQTDDGLFVIFFFRNLNSSETTRFMKWIPKGESQVEVLLEMNKLKQGQYQVAANVGSIFTQPKIYTIKSILNLSSQPQIIPLPLTNVSISFTDNKLYFLWNQDNKTAIRKIFFQQGPNKRQYILSNFQSTFEVPFKDFYNFNTTNQVKVGVSSAYSTSLSQSGRISAFSIPTNITFDPIGHHFSQTNEQQIQLDKQIPYRINIGQSITISGRALAQLSNKIVIEEPSKTFGEYYFNEQNKSGSLGNGTTLLKKITFTRPGVYILEVNNAPGSAVINRPIYVGDRYPLLPDFEDLKGELLPLQTIASAQPTSLIEQRSLLLKLINQKRTQFNVNSVVDDSQLDQLAQYHTNDMVARKFFGHYNPSGQGPQQRATKFNITQGVGENIAMNINLTDAHYRLCRSPAHLINVVGKDWIKVGLGISMNSDQYFFVAQEFAGRDYSKNPLTESQLSVYKTQLISYIQQLYPTVKSENIKLSSGLSQWQNLSQSAQNSQSILTFLRSKGLSNFSIGNIKVYFRQNFVDNIKESSYLSSSKTNPIQVGLGMKMVDGWLEIFVAYL